MLTLLAIVAVIGVGYVGAGLRKAAKHNDSERVAYRPRQKEALLRIKAAGGFSHSAWEAMAALTDDTENL
jgi:hypothetical protein